MAKLYYGNGECSIESNGINIRGIQISYKGNISIEKKTEDGYALIYNSNSILIFPSSLSNPSSLTDLFIYNGSFEILNYLVSDDNGNKVECSLKQVMDFVDLLNSNPEDMTGISIEDLKSSYTSNIKNIKKSKDIIENLSSNPNSENIYKSKLYKEDGSPYIGDFHIHTSTGQAMSGAKHTHQSENLYSKKIKPITRTIVSRDKFKGVSKKFKNRSNNVLSKSKNS